MASISIGSVAFLLLLCKCGICINEVDDSQVTDAPIQEAINNLKINEELGNWKFNFTVVGTASQLPSPKRLPQCSHDNQIIPTSTLTSYYHCRKHSGHRFHPLLRRCRDKEIFTYSSNGCNSFPGGGVFSSIVYRDKCPSAFQKFVPHPNENFGRHYYVCHEGSFLLGICGDDEVFVKDEDKCVASGEKVKKIESEIAKYLYGEIQNGPYEYQPNQNSLINILSKLNVSGMEYGKPDYTKNSSTDENKPLSNNGTNLIDVIAQLINASHDSQNNLQTHAVSNGSIPLPIPLAKLLEGIINSFKGSTVNPPISTSESNFVQPSTTDATDQQTNPRSTTDLPISEPFYIQTEYPSTSESSTDSSTSITDDYITNDAKKITSEAELPTTEESWTKKSFITVTEPYLTDESSQPFITETEFPMTSSNYYKETTAIQIDTDQPFTYEPTDPSIIDITSTNLPIFTETVPTEPNPEPTTDISMMQDLFYVLELLCNTLNKLLSSTPNNSDDETEFPSSTRGEVLSMDDLGKISFNVMTPTIHPFILDLLRSAISQLNEGSRSIEMKPTEYELDAFSKSDASNSLATISFIYELDEILNELNSLPGEIKIPIVLDLLQQVVNEVEKSGEMVPNSSTNINESNLDPYQSTTEVIQTSTEKSKATTAEVSPSNELTTESPLDKFMDKVIDYFSADNDTTDLPPSDIDTLFSTADITPTEAITIMNTVSKPTEAPNELTTQSPLDKFMDKVIDYFSEDNDTSDLQPSDIDTVFSTTDSDRDMTPTETITIVDSVSEPTEAPNELTTESELDKFMDKVIDYFSEDKDTADLPPSDIDTVFNTTDSDRDVTLTEAPNEVTTESALDKFMDKAIDYFSKDNDTADLPPSDIDTVFSTTDSDRDIAPTEAITIVDSVSEPTEAPNELTTESALDKFMDKVIDYFSEDNNTADLSPSDINTLFSTTDSDRDITQTEASTTPENHDGTIVSIVEPTDDYLIDNTEPPQTDVDDVFSKIIPPDYYDIPEETPEPSNQDSKLPEGPIENVHTPEIPSNTNKAVNQELEDASTTVANESKDKDHDQEPTSTPEPIKKVSDLEPDKQVDSTEASDEDPFDDLIHKLSDLIDFMGKPSQPESPPEVTEKTSTTTEATVNRRKSLLEILSDLLSKVSSNPFDNNSEKPVPTSTTIIAPQTTKDSDEDVSTLTSTTSTHTTTNEPDDFFTTSTEVATTEEPFPPHCSTAIPCEFPGYHRTNNSCTTYHRCEYDSICGFHIRSDDYNCLYCSKFNMRTKRCDLSSNVPECNSLPNKGPIFKKCTDKGRFSVPGRCDKYYDCNRGPFISVKTCPKHKLFSLARQKCVEASESECVGKKVCDRPGFLKDPENCSGFVLCYAQGDSFVGKYVDCPRGTVFNGNYCDKGACNQLSCLTTEPL